MAERGWNLTYSHNNGVEGHDGDGLRMAVSAGAHDVSRERCFLREAYSYGIDFFADMSQTIHRGGPVAVGQPGCRTLHKRGMRLLRAAMRRRLMPCTRKPRHIW